MRNKLQLVSTTAQQQQVAAVQQIIQQQQQAQAAAAAQQAAAQQQQQVQSVQTQQGTIVQQQTVRATPVRTLQQQRTVNVSDLVRSVQSVVAASSQHQVVAAQQIHRTSTVTTAVVMTSSTQPIVTTRMITGSPVTGTTKQLTPSQLAMYTKHQQLRQAQQLRTLQQKAVAAHVQQVVSSGAGTVIQQTTSPVTIRAQTKPRAVTDSEVQAILKRQMLQQVQQQQQAQKQAAAAAAVAGGTLQLAQVTAAGSQMNLTPGTTTLVKTLPPQTVANIIPQVKTLSAAQIKTASPTTAAAAAQYRQLPIYQQLLAQRKLQGAAGTVGGQTTATTAKVVKATGVGGTTQLIVAGGGKSLPGTMTMQQIQQVIKQHVPHGSTINVSSSSGQVITHTVITKSPQQVQQRTVIPVASSALAKQQTIQVVTASPGGSGGVVARPTTHQTIKVASSQGSVSQQQQTLLSQVTAAIQQGTMRPSPVRIQSASGQPIVAVAVSQAQQHHVIHHQNSPDQT
uniref:Uncharacterized protein n=1 Tax=Cacopsylla melanoneura TaxID=428564 RepID=A0A8D8PZH1_9HEMI